MSTVVSLRLLVHIQQCLPVVSPFNSWLPSVQFCSCLYGNDKLLMHLTIFWTHGPNLVFKIAHVRMKEIWSGERIVANKYRKMKFCWQWNQTFLTVSVSVSKWKWMTGWYWTAPYELEPSCMALDEPMCFSFHLIINRTCGLLWGYVY